jgi:hypothetical protein
LIPDPIVAGIRLLLRARHERPSCRTAKQRDEVAALHVWMAPAWQEKIERAATLVNFIENPFGDVRSTDEMIGMLTATFAPAPLGQKFSPGGK